MLTPISLKRGIEPKVLGVKTLSSPKLVGIGLYKCYVLLSTVMKDYGGVMAIKKGGVKKKS